MVASYKARPSFTAALPAACTQRIRSATAPSTIKRSSALAGTACPERGDSSPRWGKPSSERCKARPGSEASFKGHRDTAPLTRAALASCRAALFARGDRREIVLERARCEVGSGRGSAGADLSRSWCLVLSKPLSSARLSPLLWRLPLTPPRRPPTPHDIALLQAADAPPRRPPASPTRSRCLQPCEAPRLPPGPASFAWRRGAAPRGWMAALQALGCPEPILRSGEQSAVPARAWELPGLSC